MLGLGDEGLPAASTMETYSYRGNFYRLLSTKIHLRRYDISFGSHFTPRI